VDTRVSNSGFVRLGRLYCAASRLLDKLQPLLLLGFRLYVANVFWMSGLTKTRDWSITVALFTNEYHVPLLPPALAAAMGTTTELSMPLLLAGIALIVWARRRKVVAGAPPLSRDARLG